MIEYPFATKHFVAVSTVYQRSVLKSYSCGKAIVVWMTRWRALTLVTLLELPVKRTAAWKYKGEELEVFERKALSADVQHSSKVKMNAYEDDLTKKCEHKASFIPHFPGFMFLLNSLNIASSALTYKPRWMLSHKEAILHIEEHSTHALGVRWGSHKHKQHIGSCACTLQYTQLWPHRVYLGLV